MVKRAQGTAIITALFLITLVAIIATSMSSRLQVDIYRTHLVKSSDKLLLASQAGMFWAMDRLSDTQQSLQALDESGKVLDFPKKLASIYPGVQTSGSIYDLQARFNLNNVTDKTFLPMYLGLLEQTVKDKDRQFYMQLIDATANWVQGPSKLNMGHDEWFDQYTKQRPVYFPAYQPMQHPSELRSVIGVTAAIYQSLKPYITALPGITPININTAPMPLLRSLGDGISEHDANEIIVLRKEKELQQPSDLGPLGEKLNIPPTQITFKSDYFLVVINNRLADRDSTHYALLKREGKQNKIRVVVIYTFHE